MEPKDRIEEGYPPLDLEDDLYEDDPCEGLDDICGDDDDYDSFEELERLGLY